MVASDNASFLITARGPSRRCSRDPDRDGILPCRGRSCAYWCIGNNGASIDRVDQRRTNEGRIGSAGCIDGQPEHQRKALTFWKPSIAQSGSVPVDSCHSSQSSLMQSPAVDEGTTDACGELRALGNYSVDGMNHPGVVIQNTGIGSVSGPRIKADRTRSGSLLDSIVADGPIDNGSVCREAISSEVSVALFFWSKGCARRGLKMLQRIPSGAEGCIGGDLDSRRRLRNLRPDSCRSWSKSLRFSNNLIHAGTPHRLFFQHSMYKCHHRLLDAR